MDKILAFCCVRVVGYGCTTRLLSSSPAPILGNREQTQNHFLSIYKIHTMYIAVLAPFPSSHRSQNPRIKTAAR